MGPIRIFSFEIQFIGQVTAMVKLRLTKQMRWKDWALHTVQCTGLVWTNQLSGAVHFYYEDQSESGTHILYRTRQENYRKQATDELCQAQVKLGLGSLEVLFKVCVCVGGVFESKSALPWSSVTKIRKQILYLVIQFLTFSFCNMFKM